MSAIAEEVDGAAPIIKVLFTLHPGMDAMDFIGPLEVFSHAKHNSTDTASAFKCAFVSSEEFTTSAQGAAFRAHFDYKEAHSRLKEFDILVVPGGNVMPTIKDKSEPLPLIKAFADLQKKDPTRERTLMSICTGALFLGNLGLLAGLAATTHPDYYTRFENICKEAAQRDMSERTDVMEERYVVCNGRFDLGENLEENPYLRTGRRKSSAARKGSMSFKRSLTDKELHARRAAMKLAGLRVITAGGISCGIDASLYLVSAMVSDERAQEVARLMCYEWKKGVTVDAIDV